MAKSYYNTLGISANASFDDINNAYRILAAKYHPDVSTDKDAPKKFAEIQEAYNVLKNPDKRSRYDALINQDMPEDLRKAAQKRKEQNQKNNQSFHYDNGMPNIPRFGNFAPLFSYYYNLNKGVS